MLVRSFRSHAAAVLATLAMTACASTNTAAPSSQQLYRPRIASLTPTSRVFDAERIRRTGATTALDAVRLLVPGYRFQGSAGASLRMFHPLDPRSSESSIRVVIDGHELRGLDALESIPANEVVAIHLLNATEAATYFGSGTGAGAIVVQTRTSLRLR